MSIDHIRIGKTVNGSPVFISKDMNKHISVTGMSGAGKTVWLTFLETWLASKGATVIVLDCTDAHNISMMSSPWKTELEKNSNIIDVKQDGIPFSLWPEHLSGEDPNGDLLTVVDIIANNAKLSPMQHAKLFRILEKADCRNRSDTDDELGSLLSVVEAYAENCPADEKREIHRICDKIYILTKSVKVKPRQVITPGKINILKVNYWNHTGLVVSNLILDLLWKDIRSRSENTSQEIFLVLDEYQNMDLKNNAPLPNIIREGRKYGFHVVLSTQTLSCFTKEQKQVIHQAATKIYFRQTKKDAYDITRGLSEKDRQVKVNTLTSLKVGQYCAEGTFAINGKKIQSMVTLSAPR